MATRHFQFAAKGAILWIMMGSMHQILQTLSVVALPLLFAITLHEAAHGWVAAKLGDKTALMLGRVSLNPLRHIDPVGTIAVPLIMVLLKTGFIFGWAKPVPITWQNLKNPRRDMAMVALAGPGSNLLMALIWGLIAKLATLSLVAMGPGSGSGSWLYVLAMFFGSAGYFGIYINAILLVLNLLPLPPLDGSRVVSALLPPRLAARYDLLEPYGIWILLALLFFGHLQRILIPPVIMLVSAIRSLFGLL